MLALRTSSQLSLSVNRRVRNSLGRIARRRLDVRSEQKANMVVKEILKAGNGALETAVGWVPENVPRPAAKGIVAFSGAVIAWWLVQKVLSTVLTVGLLVGGAYLWLSASSKEEDAAGGGGGGGADDNDDGEDPVARARRIMNKYK